ncbi:hypothetical protein BD626DRAFT_3198 [Schizophyllum amplum]|uniref:Homeobox domain-containing protein n=1 Tax=Schizophyllum amplum TaxID=97359 RepID=A0A550CVX0_9AGAR|nr:hypothetical protein BD626DRAFT_3198 [Auriculariopsis ampla]
MSAKSTVPPDKEKKVKRTIAYNGSLHLKDFFDNVTHNPSPDQLQELMEELHGMPGNEACTLKTITEWFKRTGYQHRKEERQKERQEETLGQARSSSRYPSLTDDHVKTINALFSFHKDAPDVVVQSWALVCPGASLADVQRWVQDQRARDQGTPDTPVEGPPSPPRQKLSIRLPPLVSSVQQRPPPPLPRFRDILAEALSTKVEDTSKPPRSMNEWNEKFAPYDAMLSKFEDRLKTARFADDRHQ